MGRYKQNYTLYKRGKYWYYQTYDNRGIRTTGKTTGQTSRGAAKKYCDELFLKGELWNSGMSFYNYAVDFYSPEKPYLKDRVTPLAKNSIKGINVKMQYYILPYFKDYKLADINYTKLKEFRIWMLTQYSPSNVVSTMSCLKHIFDYAYRDGLIKTNPFSYLEPLQAPQENRDAFTLEEVRKLAAQVIPEFHNIILLMALTGMRISEAVGITQDDIKQGDGFLYIDLNKQWNRGEYTPLKNKNARVIPIIPEIRDFIGFTLTRVPALYREFQKVKKSFPDAEKRKLCFHSLRHFFITNAKARNIPDVKVEFIAGHSLKGISKVYTNFKADDLLEILEWQKNTLKELLQ